MKLAPLAAATLAAGLALGAGGVALAADGDQDPPSVDSGTAAGSAEDFAAFDECLREQGVDLPPLPDLPEDPDELTEEQLAELDDAMADVEISDEAFEACEELLPEGELDDEAFAEFDECMADAGVDEDAFEGEEEMTDEELDALDEQIDAAFDECEALLPEGELLEDCDDDLDHEDEFDDEDEDQDE